MKDEGREEEEGRRGLIQKKEEVGDERTGTRVVIWDKKCKDEARSERGMEIQQLQQQCTYHCPQNGSSVLPALR
jgi:hypothetical protein